MSATDIYQDHHPGLASSASFAAEVTPADDTDLTYATRALYIGGAGDVTVTMLGGGNVTFAGCFAGQLLPIRVTKVLLTGTDATDIVALW